MKIMRLIIKVLPFIYMGLIWLLSSKPADAYVTFRAYDGLIKESLHLVEFGILYGLFVLFFLVDGKLTIKTSVFSAIVASLWGVTDEIHQYFVPYRSATVIDVVKDIIGVVACYLIVHFSYIKKKNKLGIWMDQFAKVVNRGRG